MKRQDLTDEQWELVSPLIPRRTPRTGRPAKDPRLMLNGIFWILGTGAPWRDLPERLGSCKTVHRYFSDWRRAGVFAAIIEAENHGIESHSANTPVAPLGMVKPVVSSSSIAFRNWRKALTRFSAAGCPAGHTLRGTCIALPAGQR